MRASYTSQSPVRVSIVDPPGHKAKVYRFGVVWHWKCTSRRCDHGGRARIWAEAVARANAHAASDSEEMTDG